MAILNIVKEGDEILRKKCREVTEITPKIITLLDDMRETLIASNGCGLAAPQVGILKRIFVINVMDDEGNDNIIEFINPEIIKTSGEQESPEACLSLPGKCGITVRPMKTVAQAMDRNGNIFTFEGEELYAKCLCHENDHLDGILYTDVVKRMCEPDEYEFE